MGLTKEGLIESIVAAAPNPANVDERILQTKTLDELTSILADAITSMVEQQEDKLLAVQADQAVNRVVHEQEMRQAHEPQRKAEAAALEKTNRAVFSEASKVLGISGAEGNYALLVQALKTLSVSGIRHFMATNPTALIAPTPAELQQREAERIQAHNQMLLNADPITLKKLAQQEAEQRRAQAQQADAERQIAGREVADAAFGFPPLPEVNQTTGEKIDAAYLTRISNTNLQLFKNFIRKHGAANVTARLRGIR